MRLINADCIEAMKAMPDNSVDSIVTDPPYELGFMGKSWDASGIAFNVEVWQEALRVIKPGGHLIAFSGSRTYHRMAVAIEDAGFQIRDQIMWVYGSGFPKSHNVSKSIDKIEGVEPTVVGQRMAQGSARKIKGTNAAANKIPNSGSLEYDETIIYETVATSDAAKQWDGWGTALKPAHEPMVLARKPLEGTVANNVLTFGVGGLNIDGSRVGYGEESIDFDARQVTSQRNEDAIQFGGIGANGTDVSMYKSGGRFPANFIHDGSDEVVALFPDSKGMATQKSGANINVYGGNALNESATTFPEVRLGFNDIGSAARFFYCAKASKRDRNEGLDGFEAKRDHDGRADGGVGGDNPRNRTNNAKLNHHPTVKPTSLMQYLIRLVTPPNGIVLDPFMGSGSTGKACAYEGFEFIGIDQSAEYVAIAQARIDFALADKSDELPL
jgi:site-specific DNA-methyltransferase (adenine-specific)